MDEVQENSFYRLYQTTRRNNSVDIYLQLCVLLAVSEGFVESTLYVLQA
jgi:hypothetical protein